MTTGNATPYASVTTLDAITNEVNTTGKSPYVYWRVARTFAMIELESFRSANDWYNAHLSERPVLVYDSKSRPKYYEFRVVRDGEEIGAITAVAQKKDGGPTTYVLPHPSDYSSLSTKAGPGFKIVANGYPHVAYGIVSKAGDEVSVAIDPATGEVTNVEGDANILDFLKNADPQLLTNLGIDAIAKQEIISNITAESNNIAYMWNEIEKMQNKVINLKEDEIKKWVNASKGNYDDNFILNQWKTSDMRSISKTSYQERYCYASHKYEMYSWSYWYWCGPTAMHWVLMGIYGIANKTPQQWKDIYNILDQYRVQGGLFKGITAPWSIGPAIKEATGNQYTAHASWHNPRYIRDNLRKNKLPVISLRMSGRPGYRPDWDWAWHYRVIYGYSRKHREHWAGWWIFKWIVRRDYFYYRVHDNGYDYNKTGINNNSWWESSSCGVHYFGAYPVVRR